MKGNKRMTSSQNGSIGKHNSPPCATILRLQLKYRTTVTQTVRNQVERKTEKYRCGIKDTTSIQTGKRGRDAEQLVPYPCVVDKNSGGISWEQEVPAHIRYSPPRFSVPGRLSLQNFWLQKPAGIELVEETSEVPSSSP